MTQWIHKKQPKLKDGEESTNRFISLSFRYEKQLKFLKGIGLPNTNLETGIFVNLSESENHSPAYIEPYLKIIGLVFVGYTELYPFIAHNLIIDKKLIKQILH